MFLEKRKFKNSRGLTLSAIYEGVDKNAPVVIMCHGYGSSKDGSAKNLAQKLIKEEISVYRFDFTGCGESEGDLSVLTPKQGLDDLTAAVKDLGNEKFALYGSSFGGYIALLYASKNHVLTLGLKAPVSDYRAVFNKKYHSNVFAQQLKTIDLYRDAKDIDTPIFIVHGSKDSVVSLAQSKKLLENIKRGKRLSILHGADHDIGGKDLEDANTQLSEFFKENLT